MGKFQGSFFNGTKYRDAYIAATQRVERAKARVEGVKTQMMVGAVEDMAELETAQKELAAAQREADRLHCLWTTGKEPEEIRSGSVREYRNALGKVVSRG